MSKKIRYIVGAAEHTCCYDASVIDTTIRISKDTAYDFDKICDCDTKERAQTICDHLNEEEEHLAMVRKDMPPTTPPFRVR